MGRFYKTSKPEYLDFIYRQPSNLLLKAVEKAEAGVDKNLASVADLYGRLKSEALKPDTERRDDIIDSYKKEIDALTNAIYKDPMSYRGFTPQIKTLSDDIMDNVERGELAAMSSNVKARQKYSDKLDAQVKSTGADHISRKDADQLLANYDADFAKRKGTLYAAPSAYQTFDTGFITGEVDVFAEADKLVKGIMANKDAWASANLEVKQKGNTYIVTEKGSDEEVSKERVAEVLNSYLDSNERINSYYDTRIQERIPGFTEERKEYDRQNLLDFMTNKFAYKKEERTEGMTADSYGVGDAAWLRNQQISSETTTQTDGNVNNVHGSSSGEEAFGNYAKTAQGNVKMKTDFMNSVDRAVNTNINIPVKNGVAPVVTANGQRAYIPISQAKKNEQGEYVVDANGNFILDSEKGKANFIYPGDKRLDGYLSDLNNSKKEIKQKYEQAYNTGKGWDELSKELEEQGYTELVTFADMGRDRRGTAQVRTEQQYVNFRNYAQELYPGKTDEEINNIAQEMANYKSNVVKTNQIVDLEKQDDLESKKLAAQWTKFSEKAALNNKRFTDKSVLKKKDYDDEGNPIPATNLNISDADLAALMKNGQILFSNEAQKIIGQTLDIDPNSVQIMGGTPSENATKIEFMVQGKQYTLERGGLDYTYDDVLPVGQQKAKQGFYWTQQITLFESDPDKKGTVNKAVYDLITRGEDYTTTVNGNNINSLIANNEKRDLRIVSKQLDAADQISKRLYQEKADAVATNPDAQNVEAIPYNIGYDLGGKDLNLFSKYSPTKGVEYYVILKGGKEQSITREQVQNILFNERNK